LPVAGPSTALDKSSTVSPYTERVSNKELMMRKMAWALVLILGLAGPALSGEDDAQRYMSKGMFDYADFEPSDRCLSCHKQLYLQYEASAMAKAQILPWDQAEYFKILLPHLRKNPDMKELEGACIRCHAPLAYLAGDVPPPEKGKADPKADGVACDLCHTMTGYLGNQPYNGNYRVEPGETKFGPRKEVESYHHDSAFRPIQTSAQMCGTCHDETSFYGAWVKETYQEWKESAYAKGNIQCMDCHELPARGRASPMGPERSDVAQHLFMGGNSPEWMNGAAIIRIYPQAAEISRGSDLTFQIVVINQRAGHCIPTGSTEERQVWVHVEITDPEGNRHHVRAPLARGDTADKQYSVATNRPAYQDLGDMMGMKDFKGISRDALPEGDRLYRKVFLNPKGEETIAQWFAKQTDVFDNRLRPLEARLEIYQWTVPKDSPKGKLTIEASLSYRRLPQSVADLVNIGTIPVLEIGTDQETVQLE
jgi:hypothetical protein